MPDGDNYNVQVPGVLGNYGRGIKLLDNVQYSQATANVYTGVWCDCSTMKYASVDVEATGLTGTVNIEGTNIDKPVTATTGHALVTAPTGTALVALTTLPVRWIRARVSGFTAGSLTAQLHGVA